MSVRTLLTSLRAQVFVAVAALIAVGSGLRAIPPQVQSEAAIYRGVRTPDRFDISPPFRDMVEVPRFEEDEREEELPVFGPLGPQTPDAAVQGWVGPSREIPDASAAFDTLTGTARPPDPNGDIGPNHYVAIANARYAVYSRTGTQLMEPVNINTLWSGFGGACQTENAGDPVAIYDQLADRWVLMQFTSAGPTYFLCVAVSTGADPTGTFYRYAISTGANFPDYPKMSMWPDAFYISTREFSGNAFAGVGAYALNRTQALAGNPSAAIISFLAPPGGTPYRLGDGLLPTDLDGATPPPAGSPNYFIGSQDDGAFYGAPSDALNIWKFTANFTTPASSSFTLTNTVAVAAFDSIFPCTPTSRACVPQPGTTVKLDHQGYRQRVLHRAAYRNFGTHESIATNQSVEVGTGMSGIRWYELRSPNSSPSIFQQGTYAPGTTDGIHRWFGSIAMDRQGNMGLGYSVSDATSVFPGVRYTGRLVSDSAGTMPQGEGSFATGAASQTNSNRWGDYTSMNVDPVDDCTFWYINEYYASVTTSWTLRVGSFKFPGCTAPSATPAATIGALYPVGTGTVSPGQTVTLWAHVVNTGTVALPSDTRVWFWANGPSWSGSPWLAGVSASGLAAGSSTWYSYNWTVPATAAGGNYEYWARAYQGGGTISAWAGPQAFAVDRAAATIDNTYPVGSGTVARGSTARLWALVRNTGVSTMPADAKVWFFVNGPSWGSGTNWVGFTAINALAPGATQWYFYDWPVPASATAGTYTYWGQAWINGGSISAWSSAQTFSVSATTAMNDWGPRLKAADRAAPAAW